MKHEYQCSSLQVACVFLGTDKRLQTRRAQEVLIVPYFSATAGWLGVALGVGSWLRRPAMCAVLPINPAVFAIIVVIRTFYPTLPTLPTPKKVQQVQEVSEV